MGGKFDFEGPRRMKIIVDSISELVSVWAQCYTLDRHSIPVEACAWIVLQPPCQRAEAPGFREGDLTAGAGKGQWRRVREGRPGGRGQWRRVREGCPGGTSARRKAQSGRTQSWSRNQGRCWAAPTEAWRALGWASAVLLRVAGREPTRGRPERKPFLAEESRVRSVTLLLSHREGAFMRQVLRG